MYIFTKTPFQDKQMKLENEKKKANLVQNILPPHGRSRITAEHYNHQRTKYSLLILS